MLAQLSAIAMAYSHLDPTSVSRFSEAEITAALKFQEELNSLKHSHSSHYKMLNINAWAIAKTMDNHFPGFWNRFMANRQVALQQFLEQKRSSCPEAPKPPEATFDPDPIETTSDADPFALF